MKWDWSCWRRTLLDMVCSIYILRLLTPPPVSPPAALPLLHLQLLWVDDYPVQLGPAYRGWNEHLRVGT